MIILGILISVIIVVSSYLFFGSEKNSGSSDQMNNTNTVLKEGSNTERLERILSFFEKRK